MQLQNGVKICPLLHLHMWIYHATHTIILQKGSYIFLQLKSEIEKCATDQTVFQNGSFWLSPRSSSGSHFLRLGYAFNQNYITHQFESFQTSFTISLRLSVPIINLPRSYLNNMQMYSTGLDLVGTDGKPLGDYCCPLMTSQAVPTLPPLGASSSAP